MARIPQRGTANTPTQARVRGRAITAAPYDTRRDRRDLETAQVESDAAIGIGNPETGDAAMDEDETDER